jgi:hypothetical protein
MEKLLRKKKIATRGGLNEMEQQVYAPQTAG